MGNCGFREYSCITGGASGTQPCGLLRSQGLNPCASGRQSAMAPPISRDVAHAWHKPKDIGSQHSAIQVLYYNHLLILGSRVYMPLSGQQVSFRYFSLATKMARITEASFPCALLTGATQICSCEVGERCTSRECDRGVEWGYDRQRTHDCGTEG